MQDLLRRFTLVALLCSFAAAAACSDDDPEPTDSGPDVTIPSGLDGAWRVSTIDGESPGRVVTWVFAEPNLTITDAGQQTAGTYTFNSSTTPRQVTLTIASLAVTPNDAIYQLEDNEETLRVKVMLQGASGRAANFDAEANYEIWVLTK